LPGNPIPGCVYWYYSDFQPIIICFSSRQ